MKNLRLTLWNLRMDLSPEVFLIIISGLSLNQIYSVLLTCPHFSPENKHIVVPTHVLISGTLITLHGSNLLLHGLFNILIGSQECLRYKMYVLDIKP